MQTFAAVLGAALVAVFISPSRAVVRITSDPGGQIGAYVERFASLRRSGESVVIDGPCLSACTMVLGMIPRDHLCVTPKARFGFHAAWRPGNSGRLVASPDGTEILMATYPQQIRDWIASRGGLSSHLIYLTGRELASMLPACQHSEPTIAARHDAGPRDTLSQPLTSNFASSRRRALRSLRP